MAFYSATGTKLLNLPEQVQKNIDDIAELKESITSLQNSKQDVTGAITESNLQAKIEDIASLSLKEVSVTGLTNTGNTVNNGTLDQEGKATAGGDQEVDGNLILNSADNVVDKDGNKLIQSAALDDFIKRYNAEAYQWKFAGACINTNEEGSSNFNPSVSMSDIVNATNLDGLFSKAEFRCDVVFPDFTASRVNFQTIVEQATATKDFTITFGAGNIFPFNMMLSASSTFYAHLTKILVADGKTCYLTPYSTNAFWGCQSVTEIGAFDMSKSQNNAGMFFGCSSLKTLNCVHWVKSFDISASTAFEESDLVEIISNLDTVTTAQTLTMGATNLAKLTQEEILVATGKGWTLA